MSDQARPNENLRQPPCDLRQPPAALYLGGFVDQTVGDYDQRARRLIGRNRPAIDGVLIFCDKAADRATDRPLRNRFKFDRRPRSCHPGAA